ncbi:MAG: hypothetical protein PHW24_00580 [Candidatus Moranbacteria bacterium]|nr:hypothetical protein [Candidatus Moranbacteria bacterium]
MENVDKMIKDGSMQIGETLEDVMMKYKEGVITGEQVVARLQSDMEAFIKFVRPHRNTNGQIMASCKIGEHHSKMLKSDLKKSNFGEFVEFLSEPAGEIGAVDVRLIVLAAGKELFLESLGSGMLRKNGWDLFLCVSAEIKD